MNNTFVGGVEKLPDQLVRNYFDINQDGNLVDVTEYDLGYAKIFGGVITTNVKDLMRFNQALFGGKFLKPESQKQLLTFVELGINPATGQKVALTYGDILTVDLTNAVNSQAPSQQFGLITSTLNTFFAETKRNTSKSVPEPSSTAGLLGLGAVGMFLWRQRF